MHWTHFKFVPFSIFHSFATFFFYTFSVCCSLFFFLSFPFFCCSFSGLRYWISTNRRSNTQKYLNSNRTIWLDQYCGGELTTSATEKNLRTRTLTHTHTGYLGSFLANNLKTTQLEVNTDLQTSRAIARLKEPRNLFALPKDKDNECCSQQTARWPAECQVSALFLNLFCCCAKRKKFILIFLSSRSPIGIVNQILSVLNQSMNRSIDRLNQ